MYVFKGYCCCGWLGLLRVVEIVFGIVFGFGRWWLKRKIFGKIIVLSWVYEFDLIVKYLFIDLEVGELICNKWMVLFFM